MDILMAVDNQAWNLILLTLTFGAVVWYCYETQRLRQITAESLELQLRPYVTFCIKDTYDSDRTKPGQRIYIKNVGQGMAKNVNIVSDNFVYHYGLEYGKKEDGGPYYAKKFDLIPSLTPTEEMEIFVFKADNDKVRPQELSSKMDPKYLRIPYEPKSKIKIVYENLRGIKYFTDLEVAPNVSTVLADGKI